MRIRFHGGRVVDPSQALDARRDVLVRDGRVEALVEPGAEASVDATVELSGKVVAPGFVDIGARLGEPGFEYRETIATGLAAAAAGGYTTVACSPHTDPVLDSPSVVEHVRAAAARAGVARLEPLAAASRGLAGEQLSEYLLLSRAGAVGFSNGQRPLGDGALLRRALLHARHVDRVVMHRPEDPGLAGKGVMHEGRVSARLGLAGVPTTAEAAMIARDLLLIEEVGGRLHFHTVSARRSLDLVRQGRSSGVSVTLDVGIHHLIGCDEDVEASGFSPMVKVQPPLRTAEDREAMRVGVADGTVQAVISHHVPLDADEKLDSFDRVPFGAIGLEHAVALALSELVRPGVVPLRRMVEVFSTGPAGVLGLDDRGTLRAGARADFTVLDLDQTWTIRPEEGRSRSRNSPYAGRSGVGRPVATYLDGVLVTENGAG